MRIVTYGAACSLDGFITGPGGDLDWLHFSPDVNAIMKEIWAGTDTLLFGRKTWDFAASQGGGGKSGGMRSIVFSRTLSKQPHPGAELVSSDAGGFVRALKSEPGKGIIVMSGGNFAQTLFAEGLVDEVGLNVHPVLLGSGTPLFQDAGVRVNLQLKDCRALDGGCVYLTYRVRPAASAKQRRSRTPSK